MPAFNLVSWLKQQLDGPARKHRRSRHFFQPQLMVLEDRVAPAAFTVNTLSDTHAKNLTTGTDSTGHVSLRSAIEAADHLGGSNTISLPAGTYDLSTWTARYQEQSDAYRNGGEQHYDQCTITRAGSSKSSAASPWRLAR